MSLRFLGQDIGRRLKNINAGVSELADETDSKSVIRKGVWVRVPPPAPARRKRYIACDELFISFQGSLCAHSAAPHLQTGSAASDCGSGINLDGSALTML